MAAYQGDTPNKFRHRRWFWESIFDELNPKDTLVVVLVGQGESGGGDLRRLVLHHKVPPQNIIAVDMDAQAIEVQKLFFPKVNFIHGDVRDVLGAMILAKRIPSNHIEQTESKYNFLWSNNMQKLLKGPAVVYLDFCCSPSSTLSAWSYAKDLVDTGVVATTFVYNRRGRGKDSIGSCHSTPDMIAKLSKHYYGKGKPFLQGSYYSAKASTKKGSPMATHAIKCGKFGSSSHYVSYNYIKSGEL